MRCANIASTILLSTSLLLASEQKLPYPLDVAKRPFANKVIFAETPEIGIKWRGGFRITDVTLHDSYVNIADIMSADLTLGWIPRSILNGITQDSATDNFFVFTLKSRPFTLPIKAFPVKVGVGAKYYSSQYRIELPELTLQDGDTALSLFLTQSAFPFQRIYCNLYSSMSLRTKPLSDGSKRTTVTWYLVPGVRAYPGKKGIFSVALEYYFMNAEKLPMMPEELFKSIDQNWVSWMFYGMSWQLRHFRIDLNLTSHPTLLGPGGETLVIPSFGVGYNF